MVDEDEYDLDGRSQGKRDQAAPGGSTVVVLFDAQQGSAWAGGSSWVQASRQVRRIYSVGWNELEESLNSPQESRGYGMSSYLSVVVDAAFIF